jgi:hypothetical protein
MATKSKGITEDTTGTLAAVVFQKNNIIRVARIKRKRKKRKNKN